MAAGAPGLWSRPAARHLRAVDDDRLSSLLLRRRRRCRRPALPPALAPLPRVEHRRYLYAAVPPPHAGGGRAGGGTDQRGRSRRRVGRPEHAEAGILDGRARRTARRAGTDWRRRRLRLSRRPEAAGAALDAAVRAGMAVPPRHRAATAVEAISDEQSGVRLAGDPGALACSSPAAGTQRPRSRPAACAGGAPRQVMSRSALPEASSSAMRALRCCPHSGAAPCSRPLSPCWSSWDTRRSPTCEWHWRAWAPESWLRGPGGVS